VHRELPNQRKRAKTILPKIAERPVALPVRGKTDLIAVYAVQDTRDSHCRQDMLYCGDLQIPPHELLESRQARISLRELAMQDKTPKAWRTWRVKLVEPFVVKNCVGPCLCPMP
jgi:hypothetical protein